MPLTMLHEALVRQVGRRLRMIRVDAELPAPEPRSEDVRTDIVDRAG
jgi:hypothetical protein